VDHGGGFMFHLVRCDRCGRTKSILFDDLGELHLRYLKGLQAPYCIASLDHHQKVREHAQVAPISEDEHGHGIEAIAGKCGCDGKFTLDAPPRCPKCHSMQVQEDETPLAMYD
jgi:hypothetical protein